MRVETLTAVDQLRGATHERHVRLEALPSQQRLLARDYRRDEYRSMLERLYGFYDGLGIALAVDAVWSARVRERAELLARDLRDLGVTEAELHALARCVAFPRLDTADRVLGCAYVIEGATLGGRVIVEHLRRAFMDAPAPMRFFSGDGDATRARWQRSCATVNAGAVNNADVCAAARDTFDAMAEWLAHVPVRGDTAV